MIPTIAMSQTKVVTMVAVMITGHQKSQEVFTQKMQVRKNHYLLKKLLLVSIAVAVIIWAAMGFYVVQPAQQAAVLKFGKFSSIEGPWHALASCWICASH